MAIFYFFENPRDLYLARDAIKHIKDGIAAFRELNKTNPSFANYLFNSILADIEIKNGKEESECQRKL